MKLNYYSTKNTRSLLKLFSVLCLVAFTFCANSVTFRRTNKKSSTNSSAVRSNSKVLPDVFESTLTITSKLNPEQQHAVKITKDFLSTPLSGFKFEMKDSSKKIISAAVSPAPTGGYFVKYQLFSKGVDCQDSGFFSKNSMIYFLVDEKDSYTLTFTFPKNYILWDSVKNDDLHDLCIKIYNNYYNYKSELSKKITEVTNAISAAKNLEADKAKNMESREDFELAARGKAEIKKVLSDQLNLLNSKKQEYISEIKAIEESQISTKKDYENLVGDVRNKEQVIININKIIEEKSKSSAEVKLVKDEEINERYNIIKSSLDNYSKLYLPKDPFVVDTLSPLLANVKVNKDRIIPALRMN